MASSSSHGHSAGKSIARKRRPQPLTRSNSLLGTIKNIVTAPLAWFAPTDDFEESKDAMGKRRRLAAPPNDSASQDDSGVRSKRMRIHRPSTEQHEPHLPSSNQGYLDPPSSAFRFTSPSHSTQNLTTPTLPSSSSVSHLGMSARSTLSPMRNLSISRTMSVDPPLQQPINRKLSIQTDSPMSLRGISLEPYEPFTQNASALRREISMPPGSFSARPSFRMRSSMTPQPQITREVSEPPMLNSLMENPVFVRGPSQQRDASVSEDISLHPVTTLGSLAKTVRDARSPIRQHRSLLFGTSSDPEKSTPVRHQSPAEKALHELDIYKTPLLPTRLRAASSLSASLTAASNVPDMFKSRRASNLILMQDRKEFSRPGQSEAEESAVNKTKPYAGQGGMKKLLARRKQEEIERKSEEVIDAKIAVENDDDSMDGGFEATSEFRKAAPAHSPAASVPAIVEKADWYSEASAAASSSKSSLRVGRAKTRNHIARPISRPQKNKFSAAFEDDGDDAMDDGFARDNDAENDGRDQAEIEKRPQLFEPTPGFTFANEAKLVEQDLSKAKEPPVAVLPFSISKPVSLPEVPKTVSPVSTTEAKSSEQQSSIITKETSEGGIPNFFNKPALAPKPAAPLTKENTGGGIPNFFSTSALALKPLEVAAPSGLFFGESKNPTVLSTPSLFKPLPPATSTNFPLSGTPVKDLENPLWDGDDKKESAGGSSTQPSFSFLGASSNTEKATVPGIFNVPASSSAATHSSLPSESKQDEIPSSVAEPTPSHMSLPSFPPAQSSISAFPKDTERTKLEGLQSNSGVDDSSKISSGSSTGLFGGTSLKATNLATPFSFEHSSALSASEGSKSSSGDTTVELPKPFSFGQSVEEPAKQNSLFSFGATAKTQLASSDASNPSLFSFSGSTTSSSGPFSTTSAIASGSGTGMSNEPFKFGVPTISTPERPVTPPRNQDQEFRMEESPTRDMQQVNGNRLTTSQPFSFSDTSSFGEQAGSSTSSAKLFSFGSNPFAPKENKPKENLSFSGFGSAVSPTAPQAGFSFGTSKPQVEAEIPRPLSTGPFSFSTTPTSTTTPSFSFGAPSVNPFGQTQPSSAPNSPSAFNQPSAFSFAVAAQPTSPFSFSSQPASPTGGNSSSNLPQAPSPGPFASAGGSGFGNPTPNSPFNATLSLPSAPSSGGSLFTIGSAPSAAPPASGGPRQIRKLPNRRGGKR